MGYEIELLIGRSCLPSDELEQDKTKPFEDGSGFPYKKDRNGNYIKTGRVEKWFCVYAALDLCKLGYDEHALNLLLKRTHLAANAVKNHLVHYFYGHDGNTRFTQDRYGEPLYPVPIKEVLSAVKELSQDDEYRRLKWADALLSSMANDHEQLEVIFFGH
jgi:hypothetical protein